MQIKIINPLTDPRWDCLVENHPKASSFHQRGWLEALASTYGYEPFALTSSPEGEPLRDAVVLCGVSSWITGKRFVSLPFADHCDLLLQGPEDAQEFVSWLHAECDRQHSRYVELRARTACDHYSMQAGQSYYFHMLDLSPSLDDLFGGLHKDSTQRKIRRAEKEGVQCETGLSDWHVDEFYRLMLITRRRHKLFPQPLSWFQNLVACMGGKVQVWLARQNQTTIAAMLTLRHRTTVMYKYGCSDEKLHNLGGMPFLFWKLIEESKMGGAQEIDFGRSDLDNEGLATFKDRFGAKREMLVYCRYSRVDQLEKVNRASWEVFRPLLPLLPNAVLSTGGRLLYRHIG